MFQLQRRAWRVLTPSLRWKVFLVLICTFLISGLEAFGISLILPILGLLIEPRLIEEREWLSRIYTASGAESPQVFVQMLLFTMAAAITLKNLGAIVLNRWQIRFLELATANMSKEMFDLYLRMPFGGMADRDTGFFTYTVNSLSGIFYSGVVHQSLLMIGEMITIFLLVSVLMVANPWATMFAIGTLGASGAVIYFSSARKLRAIGVVQRMASERAVRLIRETFGAFKEIRVSGRAGHFDKMYGNNMDALANSNIQKKTVVMLTQHFIEILVALLIVSVAAFVMHTNAIGDAVGQLSLFGAASLRVMPSITRIVSSLQSLKTTEAPMDLYETEMEQIRNWRLEKRMPEPTPPRGGACDPVHVKVENVTFGYAKKGDYVLHGVDLDIPFGTVLGIAGPSGSGKTTLADLILGVLPPTSGRVLYDGEPFSDDPTKWRSKVSYVPQKISFLSGTLRTNVAFGVDDDAIDDDRVLQCLEQAQFGDKLKKLPDGLNSSLGEDGIQLSGGEKQRIGIARALYQNASVLILDEATSALDVETEDRLSEVIRSLSGSRTILIIAHRLSTLQGCARVAFMEAGRLDEKSGFLELYQSNPRFQAMVDLSRKAPDHHLD